MPLFGSTRNTVRNEENLTEFNFPIGLEGQFNRAVGPYGSDDSTTLGGPTSDLGDDNFIPQFNFNAPGQNVGNSSVSSSPSVSSARQAYLATQTPGYSPSESDFLSWWASNPSENPAAYDGDLTYLRALAAAGSSTAASVLQRAGVPLSAAAPAAVQPVAAAQPVYSAPSGSSSVPGPTFDAGGFAAARPDLVNNWNNVLDYRANPSRWASDPNIAGIAAFSSFEDYLRANWDGRAYGSAALPSFSSTVSQPVSIGQFGGAVQGSGQVTGGHVQAPISSGDESVAQQITGGVGSGGDIFDAIVTTSPVNAPIVQGDILDSIFSTAPITAPVVLGDVLAPVVNLSAPVNAPVFAVNENNAPIISPTGPVSAPIFGTGGDIFDAAIIAPTGPVSGPVNAIVGDNLAPIVNAQGGGGLSAPITAGEEIEISGQVITVGQGNVQVSSSDPYVARAAIEAGERYLSNSLAFANRALDTVADAGRDPSEKTANSALWVAGLLALATIAAS